METLLPFKLNECQSLESNTINLKILFLIYQNWLTCTQRDCFRTKGMQTGGLLNNTSFPSPCTRSKVMGRRATRKPLWKRRPNRSCCRSSKICRRPRQGWRRTAAPEKMPCILRYISLTRSEDVCSRIRQCFVWSSNSWENPFHSQPNQAFRQLISRRLHCNRWWMSISFRGRRIPQYRHLTGSSAASFSASRHRCIPLPSLEFRRETRQIGQVQEVLLSFVENDTCSSLAEHGRQMRWPLAHWFACLAKSKQTLQVSSCLRGRREAKFVSDRLFVSFSVVELGHILLDGETSEAPKLSSQEYCVAAQLFSSCSSSSADVLPKAIRNVRFRQRHRRGRIISTCNLWHGRINRSCGRCWRSADVQMTSAFWSSLLTQRWWGNYYTCIEICISYLNQNITPNCYFSYAKNFIHHRTKIGMLWPLIAFLQHVPRVTY